jgi:hypothetical protein
MRAVIQATMTGTSIKIDGNVNLLLPGNEVSVMMGGKVVFKGTAVEAVEWLKSKLPNK